jgi:DNA primase
VIGFGGRVMDGGEPKYLNSPETPLFQKGSELYGLFEARQAIRDAGYVLVTEGYMDVVALAQMGFAQAVATLGTACTTTHVQKLLRQTDQVIFSFDGDAAGRRAARRALEACLPYIADNKTIKFLFLPKEHDPDSYIREFGTQGFERQIQDAMPLSQFLLNEVAAENDLNTAEGRAKAQFAAKPMLQAMPPSALRLQIVRNLAQLTQSAPVEIETLFELKKPLTRWQRAPARVNRTPPVELERQIMRLLVAHPMLANEIDDALVSMVGQTAPDGGAMLAQLIAIGRTLGAQASFAQLAEQLRMQSADFDPLIAEVAAEPESQLETVRLELAGAIRQTKMKILTAETERLAAQGLPTQEAKTRYRELLAQQEELRREAQEESAQQKSM